MSSKVFSAGQEAPGIAPMLWRRPPQAMQPAAPDRHSGTPDPSQSAQREKEIEARLTASYNQGLAAGEAAAAQRANQKLEPALASFVSLVNELAGARRQFRHEAEQATVALAIAIARRVLHRELATDPDAILGLVKAAFQKCDARETFRLRLSPADVESVRQYRDVLRLPPAVEILADTALARGSAIFETSRGDLDAGIDTQLSEIERGFADVLAKRRSA